MQNANFIQCFYFVTKSDIALYSAAIHATNVLQKAAAQTLRSIAPDYGKEELIEDELQVSKKEYTLASEALYATPAYLQHLIGTALKVLDKDMLQHLIDEAVKQKFFSILKEAHERLSVGTYRGLY